MPPLIVGAGPAGCAAALALSARGIMPRLIERSQVTGDAICGGFMSWRTLASLESLGIARHDLAGHPVTRVALFAGARRVEAPLPGAAIGLSRRALDTAMQRVVAARGIAIERGVELGNAQEANGVPLFLATGKHDLRGLGRPRHDDDPTLGLRLRIAAHPRLRALVGDAIELHLFDRAYVGLVAQEDGSANLCLAVRKSRLTEAGGRPAALLAAFGNGTALGERMAFAQTDDVDAIAAVPYGWRALSTEPDHWRLGDQAACIPSLAGEGIGIAIASGIDAAHGFADGLTAPDWQRRFARRTRRPVGVARALWRASETPWLTRAALPLIAAMPALAGFGARLTRIGD